MRQETPTLRFFLNTQFMDLGNAIDLISIGIECSNGNKYYAISNEFNPRNAADWVVDNVLSVLPDIHIFGDKSYGDFLVSDPRWQPTIIKHSLPTDEEVTNCPWKNRSDIAFDVTYFLKKGSLPDYKSLAFTSFSKIAIANEKPDHDIEIWSYYSAYHWVAFCQLFGKMIDLPYGIPHYCLDVKQYVKRLCNPKLPSSFQTITKPLTAIEKAGKISEDYKWLKHNSVV